RAVVVNADDLAGGIDGSSIRLSAGKVEDRETSAAPGQAVPLPASALRRIRPCGAVRSIDSKDERVRSAGEIDGRVSAAVEHIATPYPVGRVIRPDDVSRVVDTGRVGEHRARNLELGKRVGGALSVGGTREAAEHDEQGQTESVQHKSPV